MTVPFPQHSYVPLMKAGRTGRSYFSASRPIPALNSPISPSADRVPSGNRMMLAPSAMFPRQQATAPRSNRSLSIGIVLASRNAIVRFSGCSKK